ncbi:Kelch repeat-containing F-box family protein isoform 1 [Tripterygium wilfordii]|uniref:Kelch repeat-containing F-box family protein isoform 1 n=1 Tax=Tripterygium wilfordii TaxID=458696 RepID=A0A7J7CYP1_TRIWF|nr:F-box/kelch-repeat protein At1g51550 [Tripterygium wilfordii]KAF5739222.1 Kelch repeat-containing F-box family protein isoform 1 [Tripterygium wilfordii]
MAETSTSSGSNSDSPLFRIAPDHLFTVLLLLPVDSILSFAMTCRRFRSLASSDTLWESICRRDWGPSSVDSLKSSKQDQQLPWMRLYKQVSRLDCVSCYKLSDPEDELVSPGPRASHSLSFVSDCLVLFGGGFEGGRHLDDTWAAYIGNDFRRIVKWQKVSSGIPSGRFGHSCVVIDDSVVLFGGINDHGNRQNDTWVGQVSFHKNFVITISWRLLDVGPTAPQARGAHAACCIDVRRMVIHGGIGLFGLRLGDTWILELSENLCSGTWQEIVTHPSPPPCSGHTLSCLGGNQTVLFGGRGLGYEVLSDVWHLYVSGGYAKWVQILYESQDIPHGFSLPRVGHSATPIVGGQILIYGGEDSYRHRKDDFWVLNVGTIPSIKVQAATSHIRGISGTMWKRLKAKGYEPNHRSFHRTCADPWGRYLYMFGGMTDGLLQPMESSGLLFDGKLFLVELEL